jgi:hypothetical protein
MSERCLTVSHGQIGMLLTSSCVRARRHSYHSQADSGGEWHRFDHTSPLRRDAEEYMRVDPEPEGDRDVVLDRDRDASQSKLATKVQRADT